MDIKGLKDKILQLGIQGKLVEQDHNDKPASILLEKIKKEREILIKEKIIRKPEKLSIIEDKEKRFELPNSWQWVRLGEIIRIYSGKGLTAKNMISEGKIPVYGGNGITGYHNEYNVEKPTIIIGRVGFYCGSIHLANQKSWVTDNAFITEYSEKNISQQFLKRLLEGTNLRENDNATAQPVISGGKIYPIVVGLPPYAEQKRIVEKIDQLFALIDQLDSDKEGLIETINLTRNQVLQEAIQGKLVEQNPEDEPASILSEKIKKEKQELIKEKKIRKEKLLPDIIDEEIPFDIPVGWSTIRYGDVAQYRKGPFGSSITKSMFVKKSETTAKIYEQKNAIQKNINIGDYYITEEKFEELKAFELKPGDIIVSCAGTIGETFTMPMNMERGILNQALMKINLSKYVEKEYYLMYFDYILNSQITNVSKGSAIKNIPPLKHLKNIVFPLPPSAEQKRIVEKVDMIMKMLDELENELISKN